MKNCYKPSLFIFDWSGVMSDDRVPVYEANVRLLAFYGKPRISFEEWQLNSASSAVQLAQSYGITDKEKNILSLYEKYLNEVVGVGIRPSVYDGAVDVLVYLKSRDKRVAVLSSHPKSNLMKEADEYGILDCLDYIEGGSRDKVTGMRDICSKFDSDVQATIYLGDTVYDIRSAKQASVLAAGVTTGYHTRERLEKEKPDYLFDSLQELKKEFS